MWQAFRSDLQKKIGIGGEMLGKLLTGTNGDIHIVFMETEDGLQPFIECSSLSGEELERAGGQLLREVQTAYLRCTVEEVARQYRQSGLSAEVREEPTKDGLSFVITMGRSNKSVIVTQRPDGTVEERVKGIAGRSCTTATELIERGLAHPKQLNRTWAPEYNATVEDREIQVLRLLRD
ncbi:DUF2997 domain-containing protein [Cohnella thermotolerans]|uniref:DUF2997 domain-containing protein n=1 Tax=Cohnella thermotolerans TaxID=329858 RepID=UPI0003FA5CD5|nr:DUF2997 domain-containing protein [Cohnella thermotolerans]